MATDRAAYRANRRKVLKTIGGAGIVGLAGCTSGGGNTPEESTTSASSPDDDTSSNGGSQSVKAAWVYNSEVSDLGFAANHEESRKTLDEKYDWLDTAYSESIGNSDVERIMRDYISQGYNTIFSTNIGYQNVVLDLAEEHPDIAFEQLLSTETTDNVGSFYTRLYQARYLQGIAAGHLTETDIIGFVASFPIPVTTREINAFTSGARTVNGNVTTKVRYTSAWFDPGEATQAATSLVDEDADVLTTIMNSTAVTEAANENGVWGGGAFVSQREAGGENYFASAMLNLNPYYDTTVNSIRDGSYSGDLYWGGLNDNATSLDDFGPSVPSDTQDAVETAKEEIMNGDRTTWDGTKFESKDDQFLLHEMGSFIEGVEGSVPQ